jgi:3-oxoacyl-[acyl-carrier protein] reductase
MKSESSAVALVTGSSRGIGRAIADRLAARGVRLAVHAARKGAAAEAAVAGLPGAGHRLFAADLSGPSAAQGLHRAVLEHFGRIDILVNNAGVYDLHPPAEVDIVAWSAAWERSLAVNLRAPADLSFLCARHMVEHGGGRIVNISSRGAFRGEPSAPAYGAAKAGLNALGQSLARAFASKQVLVFTLAPGWVETDMSAAHLHGPRRAEILGQMPLGRVATAAEVGDAATWLALDAPAAMTGCIIDINGASYLRT